MASTDTLTELRGRQESPVPTQSAALNDADESELPTDAIFTLLKNERRRRVLEHLDGAEGPIGLGMLAEEIAAEENDATVATIGSAARKRVYVALYQCHLPKMADMGVVDYDRRGGRVELTDEAEQVLEMARREPDAEWPWHKYYGGVGAGATLLFVANYLALLPVQLAANAVSAFVVASLVALSTAHGFVSRRRGDGD